MQKILEYLECLKKKIWVKNGCVHQAIMALTGIGAGVAIAITLFVILITNFEYKIEGDGEDKPTMVFDNGHHTVIKYDKLPKEKPKIFVTKDKEKDFLCISSVGEQYYKVKYNSFIVDVVADEFEIVGSDKKIIKISRGKSCVERVIEKIEEKIYT